MRSKSLDGYRLLLESAMMGVVLSALARLILVGVDRYPFFRTAWKMVAPDLPYLGTACMAAFIGFVSPYLVNVVLQKTGVMVQEDAQGRALERHGNQIQKLLRQASVEERPVSLTLNNRKTYVGWVIESPGLTTTDAFLSIIPIFSGYRDKDTLELAFTTDYLSLYDNGQVKAEDFCVVIPVPSITMIGFFDYSIYPAFIIEGDQVEGEAESNPKGEAAKA